MLAVHLAALALATTAPPSPLGIAFTPAGLLFPYYVGVGYELRELGVLTPSTPLGGSSAGWPRVTAGCSRFDDVRSRM